MILIGIKKYSHEYVKEEFNKRGYELLTKENEYSSVMQKLKYVCVEHRDKGVLQISFSDLMRGRGCFYCGLERTAKSRRIELNRGEAKELCEKHNFEFVDIVRENGIIYIKFICNNHKEFGIQKMRKSNMRRDIKGCKYCRGVLPKEIIVNRIKEKNPEYEILSECKNMTAPIKCFCSIHNHTWATTPQSLLNDCGCYYCGLDKLAKFHLHTQEEFESIIRKSNPDVDVISEYTGLKNDVIVKCKKCGYEWKLNANSLKVNGTRCKKCSYTYKGEDEIIKILEGLKVDYIHQFKIENCKDKRPLPFDFYLPQYNCCIEFDGIQHFEPRFGDECFKKTTLHDEIKNKYCLENNIKLLRIPYWESGNIKDLIINKIINPINN